MNAKIFALFLCAAALLAQPPAGRSLRPRVQRGLMPGGAQALKQELGLSEAQVRELRELRRQRAESARLRMEQLRENRRAVAEAMRPASPDAARVGQLMVEGRKLRESLRASGGEYRARALSVLTPEQKARLGELQQAGRQARALRQAMALGLVEPPRAAVKAWVRGPVRDRRRRGRAGRWRKPAGCCGGA